MKLPQVRFTVRRMMVAVAMLAILLWSGKMTVLSTSYRSRARAYAWMPMPRPKLSTAESPHDRWAAEMAEKYRHAARYPWVLVAPDPPEPEW